MTDWSLIETYNSRIWISFLRHYVCESQTFKIVQFSAHPVESLSLAAPAAPAADNDDDDDDNYNNNIVYARRDHYQEQFRRTGDNARHCKMSTVTASADDYVLELANVHQ